MTNETESSTRRDFSFWTKIVATQYLIRHPFWKSFSVPLIIGRISEESKIDYTEPKFLYPVYFLIGAHFISGFAVSDRRFRHAAGFLPHLISLCLTSILFYSQILNRLPPWIRIRIVLHTLGNLATFSFVASLHTKNNFLKSSFRRISSIFHVFYFVLYAYVFWWSNDEIRLFPNVFWSFSIRSFALICFFLSAGFALDLLAVETSKISIIIVICHCCFDLILILKRYAIKVDFSILFDFLVDDLAILSGHFYLYQFNLHQKNKKAQ